MNLIENIKRINTLINEDKKGDAVRNMIDKMGISDAIKLVGNYYLIEPYLKEIDKVNFIKEQVDELSDSLGLGLVEINEEPIHFSEDEDELRQIEYLGKTRATIGVYDSVMGSPMGDYNIVYESLPSHIIELLVEILLNH
jgi:hypothetical protein